MSPTSTRLLFVSHFGVELDGTRSVSKSCHRWNACVFMHSVQAIQRPSNRSHDAAWLSRGVLGIVSDTDGLETHEVTMDWPLTVEKRTNFHLPTLSLHESVGMLTFSVSSCAVGSVQRSSGRCSLYSTWRAFHNRISPPRVRTDETQGLAVLVVKTSHGDVGENDAFTIVIKVAGILTLALCGLVLRASLCISSTLPVTLT